MWSMLVPGITGLLFWIWLFISQQVLYSQGFLFTSGTFSFQFWAYINFTVSGLLLPSSSLSLTPLQARNFLQFLPLKLPTDIYGAHTFPLVFSPNVKNLYFSPCFFLLYYPQPSSPLANGSSQIDGAACYHAMTKIMT